ncbi:PA2778 family cysteine peptidase [Marinimicrobium alkaliphilum]|uniref:PA2778 family cysteine peptidase n=1 Tax=Marinimicrobium alkaliphilum TaxID=2202654 RepID=UPI000DB9FA52|nr:PA2778 family cysteine peptidase [Marinimicrobium alkaliphilum]
MLTRVVALLGATLLAGCANAPLQYPDLDDAYSASPATELSATAFFPQTDYQCGPSALATLLHTSGLREADPDALSEQVYLPGRQGSLQTELLAASRRAERVPYVLEPELADLLTEIQAGNPVLVLQNLQLPRWPQWHYAVVIGFDLEAGEVILRSGEEYRQVMSLRRFERTWQLGDYWALVITAPDAVPATARPQRYLQAALALEQQGRVEPARKAYHAAANHWLDSPLGPMALGNLAYQEDDYSEAERQFGAAIERAPEAPAGHYNLAWALARQGQREAALAAANRAQQLAPAHSRYAAAVTTLSEALD